MFNSRFVLAVTCAMSVFFVDFVEVQAQSKKDPEHHSHKGNKSVGKRVGKLNRPHS